MESQAKTLIQEKEQYELQLKKERESLKHRVQRKEK